MKNPHNSLTEVYGTVELFLLEAMEIQNAKFGAIQIFDAITNSLQIVLQKGFEETFIEPFMKLSPTCKTVCARTFRLACDIMIADIEVDGFYKESLEAGITFPFKAVHCTPIFNSFGEVIGILNTHYGQNLHLSKSEIELKEIIAGQIALVFESILSTYPPLMNTSQHLIADADTNDLGISSTKQF